MTDPTALINEIKHWTAPHHTVLVLQLLCGEAIVVKVARQYGLIPSEIEQWRHAFLESGTNGLKTNPGEELGEKKKKIDYLRSKIG